MNPKTHSKSVITRVKALMSPAARRKAVDDVRGFVAMPIAERDMTAALRWMESPLIATVYEHWWRPGLGRLMKGVSGPSMSDEYELSAELMDLEAGDVVLDLACGPGNFTRRFAKRVAPGGLVVGFDASEAMLERALADNAHTGVDDIALVRGDAMKLPFSDDTFDSVCCFAALHMMPDAEAVLDEIVRVLRPGGRVTILTSCRPSGPPGTGTIAAALSELSGQRMFGRNEVTGELQDRGFLITKQIVGGVHQTIGARLSE